MRIIAGSRRGHTINAPAGQDTRPTSDRVRENVFNIVGPVDGASVLDLYAGSGAMGLEALSRGAARAVFVESDGEAVRAIESRTPLRPAVGLVLGSGLGAFAKTLDKAVAIPYREIPHFPVSTAIGHAGELVVGTSGGVPVAVMAGRVHYYEGYSFEQVVFPVRVLGRFGVKTVILTNAAGSVNVNYKPGELMVIEDHINYMGGHPLIGPNDEQLGPRFYDMSEAYDPRLREIAEKACWKAGVPVRHGVYIAFTGPSYETPAEIRMARTMGAA